MALAFALMPAELEMLSSVALNPVSASKRSSRSVRRRRRVRRSTVSFTPPASKSRRSRAFGAIVLT
jgi:hypothetical protein